MENKEVVSTLNDLIETCKDGEQGFKTCAQDASNPELKSYFMKRAEECVIGATELQQLVMQLGGKPEDSSSLGGTLHRRWVDIKSALTGTDDAAVLEECERGEDIAVATYREALNKDLPHDVRDVVEKQMQGVQHNHDQVKQLRNMARSRT